MTVLKRILVAEDDPRDLELVLTAFEGSRLISQIETVRDGQEVLDYLHRREQFRTRPPGNPVVVLLDLKMPKLSGVQVLRQMKKDDQLKMIPVVMLTSSREQPDLKESYELGANAYVVKPVDFHQFVTTVKELGIFWAVINEPPPDALGKSDLGTV